MYWSISETKVTNTFPKHSSKAKSTAGSGMSVKHEAQRNHSQTKDQDLSISTRYFWACDKVNHILKSSFHLKINTTCETGRGLKILTTPMPNPLSQQLKWLKCILSKVTAINLSSCSTWESFLRFILSCGGGWMDTTVYINFTLHMYSLALIYSVPWNVRAIQSWQHCRSFEQHAQVFDTFLVKLMRKYTQQNFKKSALIFFFFLLLASLLLLESKLILLH